MRLNFVLLLIVGVFLAHSNAASDDEAKLSKLDSSNVLVQANDAIESKPTKHRLLRTSKTVDGGTSNMEHDEERGVISFAKKLKLEANLRINHPTLLKDPAIKENLKTFKGWYAKGKTPEDVWQYLNLAPLMKERFNLYGGIKQMKQEPKFQQYLNYEKFYKIIKRTAGKKA
ncbi:hypothetical protein PHYBOEH_008014 [Phytophthora boehmeriae]|uniref:RxLR effector protein n=1 Tax=Phytophthora boehmeriae TaxID=109152 RepID=A0A8T1W8R2_9STRA|nr:hypothetical protein PHYBOEH_008014 [Phytophthora boehmeriae]